MSGLIAEYLEAAGHAGDVKRALFRSLHHGRATQATKAIAPDAVYRLVRGYSSGLGFCRKVASLFVIRQGVALLPSEAGRQRIFGQSGGAATRRSDADCRVAVPALPV